MPEETTTVQAAEPVAAAAAPIEAPKATVKKTVGMPFQKKAATPVEAPKATVESKKQQIPLPKRTAKTEIKEEPELVGEEPADEFENQAEQKDEGEPAPEAKPVEFDAALKSDALALGLSEEEIKEIGGEQELRRFVNLTLRRLTSFQPQQAAQVQMPAQAPAVQPEQAVGNVEEYKFSDEVLSELDEGLTKELRQMSKFYAEQNAKIRMNFEQKQFEEMQRQEEDAFDASLDEMPEFSEYLGKGFQKQGTPQFNKRAEIWLLKNALMQKYSTSAQAMPDKSALIRLAARSVFADKIEEMARKKIVGSLKQRSTMVSGASTPQGERQYSPEETARRNVARKMKEMGASFSDNDLDDEEF